MTDTSGPPPAPEAEAAAASDAWCGVASTEDLGPLGVIPAQAFGRDLVLWRTEDGVAHAADAECPHYRVHMGRGGKVKDGALACPIHGLRFDAAGRCLPAHAGRPAPGLSIRVYPTLERGGLVHVRDDGDRHAPA